MTGKLNLKLGSNFLAYGYYQIVTLAVQFVLVPFFLKFWGKDLYGEWIVLSGIPTMMTLVDFGVTQASASKATMEASAGLWQEVKVTMNSALAFNIGVIAVLLPTSLALIYALDLTEIFNLSILRESDSKLILSILFVSLSLSMLSWLLEASFRINDKFFLGNILLANRRLLDVIVTAICLLNGSDPLSLVLILLGSQIAYLAVVLIVAIKTSQERILGLSHASMSELKEIVRPAAAHMALPIAQLITIQGSTQILQQISGPATVVGFTMARTLVRIVLQIGQVIGQGMRPEVSRLVGKNQHDVAANLVRKINLLVSLGGGMSFIVIVFSSPFILAAWSHGTVKVDMIYVAAIGLHSIISLLWFVPATFSFAQNKHGKVTRHMIPAALVALALWIVFGNILPPLLGASILLLAPELAAFVMQMRDRMKKGKLASELPVDS